ncbi:MAG: hypothetical protein U9N73_12120 [Candidatus Auribacterota bacterium]|nr:hypothetical protein [Candidatus Auribacterota bacterium]
MKVNLSNRSSRSSSYSSRMISGAGRKVFHRPGSAIYSRIRSSPELIISSEPARKASGRNNSWGEGSVIPYWFYSSTIN